MANPSILLVGDCQRSEMSPVCDWINALGSQVDVRQLTALPDDEAIGVPDLVIACQSWPDEFSASEVSAALGRWPLAFWVCCYGAWCDSDGRNRSIWPISVRVPVVEAELRLNHVWQVLTEQRNEPLPLTASRDEAFEFDHCDGRARPGNVDGDQPITRLNVVEKTNGF
ncbi:MAG: hypothetical protein FD138_2693 [Planctomycetota bacterium]|nr:MAG: hypothetical protein FD138_2693 [Planctomycetota bacterium]